MVCSPFVFLTTISDIPVLHHLVDTMVLPYRFLVLFTTFILLCGQSAVCQEVLISEYLNAGGPELEWTEIFVVADNLNLVGWMVTDNNGQQEAQQGGVRFKDIPLWRNVRAGTIILVWHRQMGNPRGPDSDPSDGFLELNLDNNAFFEIVKFSPGGGGVRNEMNIANEGDFIQVLRADSTHVHGLGHRRPTGASYDATASPKVNADTSSVGNDRSVAVTGRGLTAYGVGVTKDSVSVAPFGTPGLPNTLNAAQLQSRSNVNHLLWRETREPRFPSAPVVSLVSQDARTQTIEWTAVVDPFPADAVTGVMLLRDTNHFVGFDASSIRDGSTFAVGQSIGSARVVAMQSTQNGNRLTDSDGIQCGASYSYRIYAYRFGADHRLSLAQTADTTARGRQWQTAQWAQSPIIRKPLPAQPVVRTNATTICPGDTVSLISDSFNAQFYFWTVDNQPVPVTGTTRITVTQPGTYRLRVVAEGGCEALSEPVVITSRPAGTVAVSPSGTFTICTGDSIVLTAGTMAPSYEWTRNGIVISGATSSVFVARQDGSYQVRIASTQGCPAVSSTVTVRLLQPQFRFEPTTLDFNALGACESGKTAETFIVNSGSTPITIASSVLPAGFSLVSPAAGTVTVPAGGRHPIVVLFSPLGTGVFTGTATIGVQPCNSTSSFTVSGIRTQAIASVNLASVDFGSHVNCANDVVREERTFVIRNDGSESLTLQIPNVQAPFYLLPIDNRVVAPGDSVSISVQYRPLSANERNRGENQTISFPFRAGACADTLRASLQASTFTPSLEVDGLVQNLGSVAGCDSIFRSTVTLRNAGAVEVDVQSNQAGNVLIAGLPVKIRPGTEVTLPVVVTTSSGFTGPFSFRTQTSILPCGTDTTFEFSGSVDGFTASLSAAVRSFGPVVLCETQPTRSLQAMLTIGNGSTSTGVVTAVQVDAPFTTDLVVGEQIIGSRTVNITYAPAAAALHATTIRVAIEPCASIVELEVTGESREVAWVVDATELDFGIVAAGVPSAERTVTVRNTGSQDVELEAIPPTLPFRVVRTLPVLPATLRPNEDCVVTLQFSEVSESIVALDSLVLVTTTPRGCERREVVTLQGGTADPGTITGLMLTIPTTIKAVVGSDVEIPISLTSPITLSLANSRRTSFAVSYDPTLLRVVGASFVAGLVGNATEVSPGLVQVELQSVTNASPLVTLRGKTYAAPVLTTPLVVSNLAIAGAIAGSQNGLLTLEGECDLESRGVGVDAAFRAQIVRSDYELHVQIEIPTHDQTTLRVFTSSGELVASQVLATGVGLRRVTVPITALANGILFCQVTHGIHSVVVPISAER